MARCVCGDIIRDMWKTGGGLAYCTTRRSLGRWTIQPSLHPSVCSRKTLRTVQCISIILLSANLLRRGGGRRHSRDGTMTRFVEYDIKHTQGDHSLDCIVVTCVVFQFSSPAPVKLVQPKNAAHSPVHQHHPLKCEPAEKRRRTTTQSRRHDDAFCTVRYQTYARRSLTRIHSRHLHRIPVFQPGAREAGAAVKHCAQSSAFASSS